MSFSDLPPLRRHEPAGSWFFARMSLQPKLRMYIQDDELIIGLSFVSFLQFRIHYFLHVETGKAFVY